MKLVCMMPIGGVPTLKALASTSNLAAAGQTMTRAPWLGQPFLFFATLPPGDPTFADFGMFPDWAGLGNVATASGANNAAMLQAMLDLEADPMASPKPSDALTW